VSIGWPFDIKTLLEYKGTLGAGVAGMPRSAKKPCRKQGCRALVDSGYCEEYKQQR